jgi:hypothetical protein
MHRIVVVLLGSFVAALGAGGCSSAPSCPATFTPCGGDISGTWTLRTGCGQSALVMALCPGASSDFSPDVGGTATFDAGGTYSLNLTSDVSGTQTLPASCLGGTQSCAMLAPSSTPGFTSDVTCSGDPTQSCTCTGSTHSTLAATGTYTTVGSYVALTGSAGPSGSNPYCVTGNQLELELDASNATYLIFTK